MAWYKPYTQGPPPSLSSLRKCPHAVESGMAGIYIVACASHGNMKAPCLGRGCQGQSRYVTAGSCLGDDEARAAFCKGAAAGDFSMWVTLYLLSSLSGLSGLGAFLLLHSTHSRPDRLAGRLGWAGLAGWPAGWRPSNLWRTANGELPGANRSAKALVPRPPDHSPFLPFHREKNVDLAPLPFILQLSILPWPSGPHDFIRREERVSSGGAQTCP